MLRLCQAARLRVGDPNGALLPMAAGELVADLRDADRAHLRRMAHTNQIYACLFSQVTLNANEPLQQRHMQLTSLLSTKAGQLHSQQPVPGRTIRQRHANRDAASLKRRCSVRACI